MEYTRRRFLTSAAGTAAALPGLNLATATPAEAKTKLTLPRWRYGKGSYADDTVLMFRGNPSHTFYGTGPVPDAPRLHWSHKMPAVVRTRSGVVWAGTGWTGSASKLGDYVFVGSAGGAVYAYEAYTGKVAWQYQQSGARMFKGSLCIYDNKIYIGNVDNLLRCIDAETSKTLWRFDTGRDLDSSPCVVNGRLYIAGENGHARCIDPQDGREIWRTFLGGVGPGTKPGSNGSETSPAIADGEFYAATYDGDLFCLDTGSGAVKWKTRTHDDTDASPVVAGDFVYAAAEEKASHLFAFERSKGKEIWRYSKNTRGYWSTPAVAGGRIYIGGDDNRLHCVDARSGRSIWTFKTGGAVWSSPAVVDGKVIFGSRDAHLYMVDAQSGRQIWRHKVAGRIISSPCVVDGYIWVGTATGTFYCFGQ
ncbi:MAG: PQQ-binding-like beta-propeller repeat protein [Rhodobacteraceae bacterium]|nr:PQQ-binding-like beta-propeller repeat protein [Paracoccaceae bacterium]